MARNRPVMTWMTRQRPNMDPKFHQIDRLLGAGRSISLLLAILIAGWVFRIGLNIGPKKRP